MDSSFIIHGPWCPGQRFPVPLVLSCPQKDAQDCSQAKPGLGAHPSRLARLSAGMTGGEGCGLTNGAANSSDLAVIAAAAGSPSTSPAKGHKIS